MKAEVVLGDCLDILKTLPDEVADLVYLDPPFYTQQVQKLWTRARTKEFRFTDVWDSVTEYAGFLHDRLVELRRVLKSSGSIFFHCDRNASHIARILLDDIFGVKMFRAEIIWHYRRWSNSQKNLLPSHQNILFYSKTDDYKFNEALRDYSPTTNVDQILQRRKRDGFGKAVYARDGHGNVIPNGVKKGVPLGDVWDIPFLNPKARERTGYPSQKPILLLERIIELVTDEGDTVLDPFCGSGTTLVAATLLGRNSFGIDTSKEAVSLTKERLANPAKTRSYLLEVGSEAYENADEVALEQLKGLDIVPVHRNKGIDAFLKAEYKGAPVPIRVQREGETLAEAAHRLYRASKTKNVSAMLLVTTSEELELGLELSLPPEIIVVQSTAKAIRNAIRDLAQTV